MTNPTEATPHTFTSQQAVLLVFLCTLIGAAAQVFMKIGGTQLQGFHLLRILTDWPLLAGYACYALNTVLLMLALRDGELSKLYPVIALTFVWVNILSISFFHERLNAWKVCGMAGIMAGVALLGWAQGKRE